MKGAVERGCQNKKGWEEKGFSIAVVKKNRDEERGCENEGDAKK